MSTEPETTTRVPQKKFSLSTELLAYAAVLGASAFRAVAIYLRNRGILSPDILLLNLAIVLGVSLLLYCFFRVATNHVFAAVLLAVFAFFLISWPDFYAFFYDRFRVLFPTLRLRYALLVAFAFFVLLCYLLRAKVRKPYAPWSRVLLIAGACMVWSLLALNVVQNVFFTPDTRDLSEVQPVRGKAGPVNRSLTAAERPNIYFLLLDEYANFDMLEKQFGYDNSAFLDWLHAHGFTVSESSRNEFSSTPIITANLLALDYICFADDFSWAEWTNEGCYRRENDDRVSKYDKTNGYRAYAYLFDLLRGNGYYSYILDDAANDYNWGEANADKNLFPGSASVNQNIKDYLYATWLYPNRVLDLYARIRPEPVPEADVSPEILAAADNTVIAFSILKAFQPPQDRPVFLYAHIDCPHSPFAYFPDGTRKPDAVIGKGWEAENAYTDNLQYATREAMAIIDHIQSIDPDAVIVLQSDHGARYKVPLEEMLPILNAVYYRGESYDKIEGLSGVNTLRQVLSDALQIDLPPVEPPVYITVSE